ncbi:MAG: amidohydrolase [Candidatus Micrarchaeia archaeon]
MQENSILIKNAVIITQNEKREIFNGDILIENNLITGVGKNLNYDAKQTFDAKNKIAMPGLINTHTHIAMTLLRGYGEGLSLHSWLLEKIWPAEAKLTEKSIYWGTLLGALEMISSGTTCFCDMYLIGLEEIAKASKDAGLRAVIGYGMIDKVSKRDAKTELLGAKDFVSKIKNKSDLIKPAIAPHAPYTCSDELIIKSKEFAKKEKLLFHMHVSETRKELFDFLEKEGKRPFEYLNELGIIDEDSSFAHASWVSKREIDIIGKNHAHICHCPVSNLKLATGGICPIYEYEQRGGVVSIATDGASSNNSLNMFESMKIASLMQNHKYWNNAIISAQKIFDFATINGAKTLEVNAGSIESGKLADIVFLDANSPNLNPIHDLIANIVYSSNPSNITDVIINGEIIYRDRKFVTLNPKEIFENVNASIKLFV